jgi:hypothetical protein
MAEGRKERTTERMLPFYRIFLFYLLALYFIVIPTLQPALQNRAFLQAG